MSQPQLLEGLRVVELASELAAFAGKLLGDMGAEVIVVEPPDGHTTRSFEPFLDDEPGAERSLWWWHYNTSKRGVTIDLDREPAVFRELVATADLVIEAEPPGRLAELGLDHTDLRAERPDLIWVSVTPFGRDMPDAQGVTVDLTLLAEGGPMWSCGYDDHSLPPVRGGGNQGYQTACIWAVMAALTAVLHRDLTGLGQHLDVNAHAAQNVTTEAATYSWLVAQETVQRQTGRHAAVRPTMSNLAISADGKQVHTGVPPRTGDQFRALIGWIDELGLREELPGTALLEAGIEGAETLFARLGEDDLATAIIGAAREAVELIASGLTAYEFFTGAQQRGLSVGVIYSPEEVMNDPHFIERGFPVEIEHEDLQRSFTYPGAPFVASGSPVRVERRAPRVGEHNAELLGPLGS